MHSLFGDREVSPITATNEIENKDVSIRACQCKNCNDRHTMNTLSRGMNAVYGSNCPNDSQLDRDENDKAVFTKNIEKINIYRDELDQ